MSVSFYTGTLFKYINRWSLMIFEDHSHKRQEEAVATAPHCIVDVEQLERVPSSCHEEGARGTFGLLPSEIIQRITHFLSDKDYLSFIRSSSFIYPAAGAQPLNDGWFDRWDGLYGVRYRWRREASLELRPACEPMDMTDKVLESVHGRFLPSLAARQTSMKQLMKQVIHLDSWSNDCQGRCCGIFASVMAMGFLTLIVALALTIIWNAGGILCHHSTLRHSMNGSSVHPSSSSPDLQYHERGANSSVASCHSLGLLARISWTATVGLCAIASFTMLSFFFQVIHRSRISRSNPCRLDEWLSSCCMVRRFRQATAQGIGGSQGTQSLYDEGGWDAKFDVTVLKVGSWYRTPRPRKLMQLRRFVYELHTKTNFTLETIIDGLIKESSIRKEDQMLFIKSLQDVENLHDFDDQSHPELLQELCSLPQQKDRLQTLGILSEKKAQHFLEKIYETQEELELSEEDLAEIAPLEQIVDGEIVLNREQIMALEEQWCEQQRSLWLSHSPEVTGASIRSSEAAEETSSSSLMAT